MPRPTSSTVIVRPDLGVIAYEYALEASQRGFIADALFPVFEVEEESGQYPMIPLESLLKLPESVDRAPRADYQRRDYKFEMNNYSTRDRGIEEPVDDVEAKLYRRYFDAEAVAVTRSIDTMLRVRERRVAEMVQNPANITHTGNVTYEWSKPGECTPAADVKAAKSSLRAATGVDPNAAAMSKKVFGNLLVCAEIRNYLQYTNPHLMANEEAQKRILAQYLGLDEIQVGDALHDSAKKNKAALLADIWDDEYVLLYKKSGNALDLKDPVLGRTFLWIQDSPGMLVTEQYREESKRSEIYRVRNYTDECFVFQGAAYLMGNITE